MSEEKKQENHTGRERNILFLLTKTVSIFLAMKQKIWKILTVCSAIARCTPLAVNAAGTSNIRTRA